MYLRRIGFINFICRLIRFWALLGGFQLIGIVLMTAYSATSNLLIRSPLAGDFEIVEMGAAIAVFAFLPYCQLTNANVSVDIFTMRAGPRAVGFMTFLSSLIAILFSAFLLWRMSVGMVDYLEYDEFTAILGIPLWVAFPPILFSIFLLALASLITAAESIGMLRQGDDGLRTR